MDERTQEYESTLRTVLKKIKGLSSKLSTYSEPIAIVGMGCRFPGGANDPEAFWQILSEGVDGISEVPQSRFDVDQFYDPSYDVPGKMYTRKGGFLNVPIDLFDADFFNITPKEAENMDPQQRLLLEVTWEALEHAGIPPQQLAGSITGIFVGMMYSDYTQMSLAAEGYDGINAYSGSGNAFSAAVGRVSYTLGLHGPCLAIDTACSSSLVAIDSACESLHLGKCRQAIAGGVNLMLSPGSFISACQAHMLAPDGHCKTFDKSADGYARSEGCGMIVLKRLSDAQRDGDTIYALIRNSGVNQGGATSGLTVPNGKAQEALLRKVYSEIGLTAADIDYVEAHGTGTSLGDPIEMRALGAAYGTRDANQPLLIGSAKSNIGHAESAAGIAGVIKMVLTLNHQALPGNLSFKELNPNINLNFPAKILTELTPWLKGSRMRRAGVSSFGFSGTNAHVIIEEAPQIEKEPKSDSNSVQIFTLSAKSPAGLTVLISEYIKYLGNTKDLLENICYTVNTGRNHERFRIALVIHNIDELQDALINKKFLQGEVQNSTPKEIPVSTDTNQSEELLKLAEYYIRGGVINWQQVYTSTKKKIALPTYPFQRQHYWSKSARTDIQHSHSQSANHNDELIYKWEWKEHALDSNDQLKGHWLMLGEDSGLRSHIERCRMIKDEDLPKSKEEFISLLQSESYSGIIHLASLNSANTVSGQSIKQVQSLGIKSLFHLSQALVSLENEQKLPFRIICSDALVHSTVHGFFKALLAEHPELDVSCIQLGEQWDTAQVARAINEGAKVPLLSISDNKFYIPRFLRWDGKTKANHENKKISSQATYLITGGLGGIGLSIAQWLVSENAGHIVLTGRRDLNPEIEHILKAFKDSQEYQFIDYMPLDIIDENAVQSLLSKLTHAEKPLKGIFHSAGELIEANILDLDWSQYEKLFDPKVYGSLYLSQHSNNLDLFVLFSSVSASLGGISLTSYAAANSFLDGLSIYRKNQGLPALSIAWGPWVEVGMAKDIINNLGKFGMIGLLPKEATHALSKAILSNEAWLTIANINWPQYLSVLPKNYGWFDSFVTKQDKHIDLYSQLQMISPDERQHYIRQNIIHLIRSVIGLSEDQPLDEQKGFFEMGMDSLMAVDLRNKLQLLVGEHIQLKSTVTFDYPNIDSIIKYIVSAFEANNHVVETAPVISKASQYKLDEVNLDDLTLNQIREQFNQLRQQNHSFKEPIAIIGMACRLPGHSNTPELFWDFLRDGRDALVDIPKTRFDIDEFTANQQGRVNTISTRKGAFIDGIDLFDPEFFGINHAEAQIMDPQQRLLLHITWEAIESAGIAPSSLMNSKTGVFIGASFNDYGALIQKNNHPISAYFGTGNSLNGLNGRLSYAFGLQGPSMTIDTACSSTNVSIHTACTSLYVNDCDMAIAGGVNLILNPLNYIALSASHMLAPDGHCKTFDARANGYARGEGAGVFILKKLSKAQKDGDPILAVILGTAVNQDGHSSSLTVPNGIAQQELIHSALDNAHLKPQDIDFIEAHGTGTSLGDPIEINALGEVYSKGHNPEHPFLVGAVKTNVGHLEAAAGVPALIKTIFALQHHQIPGNLHFHQLNPKIDLSVIPAKIVSELTPWPASVNMKRTAGISGFGFTGTNAHLILQEAPQDDNPEPSQQSVYLLVLSARTAFDLKNLIDKYITYLEYTTDSLANITWTAAVGRNHEIVRIALLASDINEMKSKLARARTEELQSVKQQPVYVHFNHTNELGYQISSVSSNKVMISIGTEINWESLYDELAQYYLKGGQIDWVNMRQGIYFKKVRIPTYAFNYQPIWSEFAIVEVDNQEKFTSSDFLLRKYLSTQPLEEHLTLVIEFLEQLIGSELGITLDTSMRTKNFYDLGMDSLRVIELNNKLQRALGTENVISPAALLEHPSIQEMASYITQLISGKVISEDSQQQTSVTSISSSDWLHFDKKSNPKLRIFCFHHAGAGASTFKGWQEQMPEQVELMLIQLPGREKRYNEPLIYQIETVVIGIINAILPYLDVPYMFFGHSLGALIAAEVMGSLRALNLPMPVHAIFSGASPLYFNPKLLQYTNILKKDDEQFLQAITQFIGIPDHLMNSPDALKLSVPILRADFSLFKKQSKLSELFSVPITSIRNQNDISLTQDEIKLWSSTTTSTHTFHTLEGGHFELLKNPVPLINIIRTIAEAYLTDY